MLHGLLTVGGSSETFEEVLLSTPEVQLRLAGGICSSPVYQLIFLTFIMATAERRTVMMYTSPMAVPYMLFASTAYLLCCVYNVFWLHPQLQIGMSEKRQ